MDYALATHQNIRFLQQKASRKRTYENKHHLSEKQNSSDCVQYGHTLHQLSYIPNYPPCRQEKNFGFLKEITLDISIKLCEKAFFRHRYFHLGESKAEDVFAID